MAQGLLLKGAGVVGLGVPLGGVSQLRSSGLLSPWSTQILQRKSSGLVCVKRPRSAKGLVVKAVVDPWAPGVALDSQSIASTLFAGSLFPYLGFLYYITKSKTAPPLTLFGFYFLLAFVGATIPAGIYAKVHYGTSLSNVDWLHGGAESLLTLTNLFIVFGLRDALRNAEKEDESARDHYEGSEEPVSHASAAQDTSEGVEMVSSWIPAGTVDTADTAMEGPNSQSVLEEIGTSTSLDGEARGILTLEPARSANIQINSMENKSLQLSESFEVDDGKAIDEVRDLSTTVEDPGSDDINHKQVDPLEVTSPDDKVEISAVEDSEFSTRLQSIIHRENTDIEGKQADPHEDTIPDEKVEISAVEDSESSTRLQSFIHRENTGTEGKQADPHEVTTPDEKVEISAVEDPESSTRLQSIIHREKTDNEGKQADPHEVTTPDEKMEISAVEDSEFSTRLQSIIHREITDIEEKRAELEKSLNAVSDVSVKSKSLSTSVKAEEVSPLKSAPSRNLNGRSKPEQKLNGRKMTIRLSEILPLEESADPDMYLKTYRDLVSSGRLQDGVLLLEEMDKANILDTGKIHHSKFFKACQSKKAVKEAFRFLRLINKPTLSTYNMLISVCRDARDVDGGLRALSAAEKSGHKPDAILYTTLISTCAKAGKLDIAFKVFHEMETAGVVANIRTYGSLIDGCARAGQIAKAFGVYGIMLSKSVKPDLAIFNTLINACGRAGAIERAFDVLADMKAEPYFLKPNHVTFGALISACARAGQVERAFEVYQSMRQSKGMKGTPECYTAAVHACSETGDLDLARTVLEDMKTDGVLPDEIFFSALIDVAGHANEVDGAFQILNEMKHFGMVPSTITYSAVMGMCSNVGNWERALKVYQEIRESGLVISTSTFNALITALSDAKLIQQAFGVLEEMKAAGVMPDQITYSILLEACETLDEPDKAFDLYTNARAEGVVPNQAMCDSVIGICYSRLRKSLHSPEYSCSIGLVTGVAPYEQWTTWALSAYRQTVGAGVTPTIKSLSLLLGCLRKHETKKERSIFDDSIFSHYDTSKDLRASVLDGDGLYDRRALALFDEAVSMSIVPRFNYTAGPITLDAEAMPSYVAEVCLLTLLRGLKKRHLAGAQLYPVTIKHFVGKKQTLTATTEIKELSISGRSGQVMAALLRRLKLHYQGHESSGVLRIAVASIRNWLKPTTKQPTTGILQNRELGPAVPRNVFVARGIAEQQRAIRIAGPNKGPTDFRRRNNPSTDLYLKQVSQVKDWELGGGDFEAEQDNFMRNTTNATARSNGVKRPQSLAVNAVKDTFRRSRP